eukprot:734763-Ditylum_brightwellii.AAC.1
MSNPLKKRMKTSNSNHRLANDENVHNHHDSSFSAANTAASHMFQVCQANTLNKANELAQIACSLLHHRQSNLISPKVEVKLNNLVKACKDLCDAASNRSSRHDLHADIAPVE